MPSLRFRKSTNISTGFAALSQFPPPPPMVQSTSQDGIENHADTIEIRRSNSLQQKSCLKRRWPEISTQATDRRVRFRSFNEVYVFRTSEDLESTPDLGKNDKTKDCSRALRFYLSALNLLRRKQVEQPPEETESLCNAANDQVKFSPSNSNSQDCEVRETTIDLRNYPDPESSNACLLSNILEHFPNLSLTDVSIMPSKNPPSASCTSVHSSQISSGDICPRPIVMTSPETPSRPLISLPRGADTKTAPSRRYPSHSRSSSPSHTPELVPTTLETALREGLHTSSCEVKSSHEDSASNRLLCTSRHRRSWSVEAVKSFSPSSETFHCEYLTRAGAESKSHVRRAVCHRRSDAQSNICFPVNRS